MYLGEIYFSTDFKQDIDDLNRRLKDVGYYIIPSDDTDAEDNQYDLFKKEE